MIPSPTNANDRLFEIAGKSIPLRFGLNGRDGFSSGEKKVISLARLQEGFQNRYSRFGGEIYLRPILNNPARLSEEEVNLLASPLF